LSGVSDFERIGGHEALRRIVDEFVDRMYADPMIGFFFAGVPKKRIQELEFQHAGAHLGGPIEYRGRPLEEAHGKHRIMGGHFMRRFEILRQTLAKHGVPEEVAARWLAHVESLRGKITSDPGSECR
jgi:hemoglobin